MKKRKAGRTLSRKSDQRKALLRTLLVSLIERKKIQTTLAKAKELRPFAERRLSYAKKGLAGDVDKMNSIRTLKVDLPEKSISELFKLAEASRDRRGGYLRITRLGGRQSDDAPMAMIEWMDINKLADEKKEAVKEDTTVEKKEEEKTGKKGSEESSVSEAKPEKSAEVEDKAKESSDSKEATKEKTA